MRQLTESPLKEAQAIGAKSLVLARQRRQREVPASDTSGRPARPGAAVRLYGIHDRVEPLGFPQSSPRSAHSADADP